MPSMIKHLHILTQLGYFVTKYRLATVVLLAIFYFLFWSRTQSDSIHLLALDVKAFVYYHCGIRTDITVYENRGYNVLKYDELETHFRISNPHLCVEKAPFLLIFVKTHPKHFTERKIIRETWGNKGVWPDPGVGFQHLVLFVLGLDENHPKSLQQQLVDENDNHQDLIQEDFIEDFHNLTRKLVVQLKWSVIHCREATFWITTDDDVFVNIKNVINYLRSADKEALYIGLTHYGSPSNRNPKSKYYVPESVYPGVYYPGYCPGAGYILSMDVVEKAYHNVHSIPLLYIDDAYMGILAHSIGKSPQNYVMLLGERRVSSDLCTLSKFLTSHGHKGQEMYRIFGEIARLMDLNPDVVCWGKLLSTYNPFDIVYY